MLPCRSDAIPCGQEMLPCVYPEIGESACPSLVKSDSLFLVATWGVNSHGASWKPKLPIHSRPEGSKIVPKPWPLRPPSKNGEFGAFSPHGVSLTARLLAHANSSGGRGM